MLGQIKTTVVMTMTANEDQTASKGFFVKLISAGVNDEPGVVGLLTAATDVPYGIILDGGYTGEDSSIAVLGGNVGSVKVKADANVTQGHLGQVTAAGRVINDSGAGARVLACLFLESGTQDELVEAIVLKPVAIGHPVVITSAQLVANPLEADFNKLQADVVALYTALKAEGRIA